MVQLEGKIEDKKIDTQQIIIIETINIIITLFYFILIILGIMEK